MPAGKVAGPSCPAKLLACLVPNWQAAGPEQPVKQAVSEQIIDQLTALVGRAEHHHPAQIGQRCAAEIEAHQNATHGMGNEMNACRTLPPQLGYGRRDAAMRQGVDLLGPGRVARIDSEKTLPPQPGGKGNH